MSEQFISLNSVMKYFPEDERPSMRWLRETMAHMGYARKIGRTYKTTRSKREKFLKELAGEQCQNHPTTQGRHSRQNISSQEGSGTRGAGIRCASATVQSPDDDLREALDLIAAANAPEDVMN